MSDFGSFAKSGSAKFGDQLDLRELQSGDELRVVTQHTEYVFAVLDHLSAELTTSRSDRPFGYVKIMGCTFGASASIRPNHLFCGGNLEFAFKVEGQPVRHRTTEIKAIYLRRTRPDA